MWEIWQMYLDWQHRAWPVKSVAEYENLVEAQTACFYMNIGPTQALQSFGATPGTHMVAYYNSEIETLSSKPRPTKVFEVCDYSPGVNARASTD